MVGASGESRQSTLVPVSCERDTSRAAAVDACPVAPAPRRRPAPPRPRRAPGLAAARRTGTALPALGGDFLSAALALLCREEPLSRAEIGDHADVVAEVADALAAVADRLAHDLDLADPEGGDPEGRDPDDRDPDDRDPEDRGSDGTGPAIADLAQARDALQGGSVHARRGAGVLWARHIESLRAQVEQARGTEPASVTRG